MKFPFDIACFQVRTVTFREGKFTSTWDWCQNETKKTKTVVDEVTGGHFKSLPRFQISKIRLFSV